MSNEVDTHTHILKQGVISIHLHTLACMHWAVNYLRMITWRETFLIRPKSVHYMHAIRGKMDRMSIISSCHQFNNVVNETNKRRHRESLGHSHVHSQKPLMCLYISLSLWVCPLFQLLPPSSSSPVKAIKWLTRAPLSIFHSTHPSIFASFAQWSKVFDELKDHDIFKHMHTSARRLEMSRLKMFPCINLSIVRISQVLIRRRRRSRKKTTVRLFFNVSIFDIPDDEDQYCFDREQISLVFFFSVSLSLARFFNNKIDRWWSSSSPVRSQTHSERECRLAEKKK